MPLAKLESKEAKGQISRAVELHGKNEMMKRISKFLKISTICSHNIHEKIKSNVFNTHPVPGTGTGSSTSPSSDSHKDNLKKHSISEPSFVEILSPPHRRKDTGIWKTERDAYYSYEELTSAYSSVAYPHPSAGFMQAKGRSITTDTSVDNIIYSENLKKYLYPQFIRTVNSPIMTHRTTSIPNSALLRPKSVKAIHVDPSTESAENGEAAEGPPHTSLDQPRRRSHPKILQSLQNNNPKIELTSIESICKQSLSRPPKSPTSKSPNASDIKNAKLGAVQVKDSLTLIKNSVRRIKSIMQLQKARPTTSAKLQRGENCKTKQNGYSNIGSPPSSSPTLATDFWRQTESQKERQDRNNNNHALSIRNRTAQTRKIVADHEFCKGARLRSSVTKF